METERLIVETHPDPKDVSFLEDRINEYNLATTGIDFGGLLAIFVRDGQGTIIAGIYGWAWGGCCEIRFLWVHEDFRRRGIGSALLGAAEREAARRGCSQLILDTHSFQASSFYQKMAYEIVGVVEDYPRGYQKFFLRKRLPPVHA
jgi:GNAT superfamily N-acetyltransferase